MIKIGENILESSETNFMNFDHYVFDVDHVAKIPQSYRFESDLNIMVAGLFMQKAAFYFYQISC